MAQVRSWFSVAALSSAIVTLAPALPIAQQAKPPAAKTNAKAAQHSGVYKRLVISNAMVIYGNAKPPYGPIDIVIEDGLIARVIPSPTGRAMDGVDAVIDATGKYVMPGIVNTHMHWHEERQPGIPQPIQYERNLYLATGTTTAREVGGDTQKTKQWRDESNAHKIVAPRILLWNRPNLGTNRTPEEIRAGVRQAKADGFDGLKIGGLDRDQLEALIDEAKKQSLCTTTHIAVEETTATDYVDLGVCSIEHFYGVGDAALDGIQDFPPEHNANNEIHRFGRAGELYAQANQEKLNKFVDYMAERGVGWSPTMSIYEASRDIIRNQNLPWYKDWLHPSMEAYWQPSLANHGSYFGGWTTQNEARWKRDYRVWMDALLRFGRAGGLVSTGDDAGYIWSLYGFGIIREMELQEEAGFHPLEVLSHATWNGATMVGMGDRLGKVRQGWIADLLVVNGNPVENLRVLNPYGVEMMFYDGKPVSNYAPVMPNDPKVKFGRGGGIEWTIKDGIPYHAPTLMNEVKEMVAKARSERKPATTTAGQPVAFRPASPGTNNSSRDGRRVTGAVPFVFEPAAAIGPRRSSRQRSGSAAMTIRLRAFSVSARDAGCVLILVLLVALAAGCGRPGLRTGEGYVTVPGGRVWYNVVGSGPGTPLLLVHGGPGYPSHGQLQRLEKLGDERPVIFYDQLGCGRSDGPTDKTLWRTERFVDELASLRSALGLDRLHILGHSWGSMLTVEYTLTGPRGVEQLWDRPVRR